MKAKKKYKCLTKAEKEMNKKIKQTLIDEGLIQTKKRLNRKSFAKQVKKDMDDDKLDSFYLIAVGIASMMPSNGKVSSEEVGILKAVKIAIDAKQYHEDNKERDITIGELYENVIKPIKNL